MNSFEEMFRDPEAASRYAEGPPKFMPGYADMQRMSAILLAETAGKNGHIFVLGAGGGLELAMFAQLYPDWHFTGVDPAAPMLELARANLGENSRRAQLIEGLVGDAPQGPYDAACCLLTLHFLSAEERLKTLKEIRQRLKPGAAFTAAHSSFSQKPQERKKWLDRYAAFALAKGAEAELVEQARANVEENITILNPESDITLMREAGFANVEQYYAGFSWRGWVGYA